MKRIILLISLVLNLFAYSDKDIKEVDYIFNVQTKLEKYKSSLDISLVLEVDDTLNKKDIETKLKNMIINTVNMYDRSYFYSKTNTNQTLDLMLEFDIKQNIVKKNEKIKSVKITSIKIIDPLNSKAPSTKELYNKKCASCHGRKGLQQALGVSAKIANMSKDDIYKSLKGYKNHNLNKYGKASFMWRYVDRLSDKNLDDLSTYIDKNL